MCLKFQIQINVSLFDIKCAVFKRLYISSLCYKVEQIVNLSNIFSFIISEQSEKNNLCSCQFQVVKNISQKKTTYRSQEFQVVKNHQLEKKCLCSWQFQVVKNHTSEKSYLQISRISSSEKSLVGKKLPTQLAISSSEK